MTESSQLRILVADDHDLLRDMLQLYLGKEPDISVETVADFNAAFDRVKDDPVFDLVMLDYSMPGMTGLEGMQRIQDLPGDHRVGIISGTATRDVAQEALEKGAAGFVPKTLSAKSLINAVRFMAAGEQFTPIEFLRTPEPERNHPLAQKLSRREMDVLKGLTEGKSNKEIARDLDIREPTVKLHVKTLYRKIGVANRTQAALIAKEHGLY